MFRGQAPASCSFFQWRHAVCRPQFPQRAQGLLPVEAEKTPTTRLSSREYDRLLAGFSGAHLDCRQTLADEDDRLDPRIVRLQVWLAEVQPLGLRIESIAAHLTKSYELVVNAAYSLCHCTAPARQGPSARVTIALAGVLGSMTLDVSMIVPSHARRRSPGASRSQMLESLLPGQKPPGSRESDKAYGRRLDALPPPKRRRIA